MAIEVQAVTHQEDPLERSISFRKGPKPIDPRMTFATIGVYMFAAAIFSGIWHGVNGSRETPYACNVIHIYPLYLMYVPRYTGHFYLKIVI